MTLDDEITVRSEGAVRWITIDRPDAANAIAPPHRNRIIDLLDGASADPAVRAVVLTGSGARAFCTGADLRGGGPPPVLPDGAPDRIAGDVARLLRTGAQRLIRAVWECEKPVIAAVNGTAAGIGSHLALACDLVVAAENAKFIEVFVRRGLVPDGGGAWLLPRLVGTAKAKELMFFGEDLPAAQALQIGLITRVVPAEELEAAAREWAQRLAAGPTRMLSMTKRLINRGLDTDFATNLEEEAMAQEVNMTTVDAQEGVRSFVERRTPVYQGW